VYEPVEAPDTDSDGISDLEERGFDGMDPSFDGNNDGIPDWKQSKAASLKNYRKNSYLTLASLSMGKNDIPLVNVKAVEVPAGYPTGFVFPYDLVEFSMELPSGTSGAEVNFYTHGSDIYDNFMNYGPLSSINIPEWYNFRLESNTGATLATNMFNLKFVDGQRGDHDMAANNIITTLGGPAKSPEGLPEASPQNYSIKVKSNPATDHIQLSYYAKQSGWVTIYLYSSDGKRVGEIFKGEVSRGEHHCGYSLSHLAAGVYYCRMEMQAQTDVCKLLVAP
jgi:hypothetical protein